MTNRPPSALRGFVTSEAGAAVLPVGAHATVAGVQPRRIAAFR
ncbi:MAG TPA: hypothetical protein VJ762_03300 [Sphingobium sp.]|nr:hypothetical protein [Sphingobium sp.]